MYANITFIFHIRKQIVKIFHIAGIYFTILLQISKIMLIFVADFVRIELVIIFAVRVPFVVKREALFVVI